jgi:hypothetical protein
LPDGNKYEILDGALFVTPEAETATSVLRWTPAAASEPLDIDVAAMFTELAR